MAAANKTKYLMFDYEDFASWKQFDSLESLKEGLTEMAKLYDQLEDNITQHDMEIIVIKVPPNQKAKELNVKCQLKMDWEITE